MFRNGVPIIRKTVHLSGETLRLSIISESKGSSKCERNGKRTREFHEFFRTFKNSFVLVEGEESLKWNIKKRKRKEKTEPQQYFAGRNDPRNTVWKDGEGEEGVQQIPPRLAPVPEGVVPSARMIHPYKFRNAFILFSILLVPVRIFTTRPSHDPASKGKHVNTYDERRV